jgi:hypothetical protein
METEGIAHKINRLPLQTGAGPLSKWWIVFVRLPGSRGGLLS